MIYSNIRSTIKTGDLIAFSGGNFSTVYELKVSLVRAFTRSEFSHIGVAWVTEGRVFLLDAVIPKIRIFPLSLDLPGYLIRMPNQLSKDATEYALSLIGQPYSNLEAIKAFLNNVKNGENGVWECAEYVANVWGKDIPEFNNIQATPTTVVQYCLQKLDCKLEYIDRG
jgi:hypothetical protein